MRLEDSTSIRGIKSKSNKYLSVSRGFAKMACFDGHEQVQGLNDHQIVEHAYATQHYDSDLMAEEFILEDEIALREQSCFIFDVVIIRNKLLFFMVNKQPYYENNRIAGSQFHSISLANQNKQTIKSYLSDPDILVSTHTKKHLDVYQLAPHRKYSLSKRELQCAQLLAKGFSAKSIAEHLGLSSRTVESYIYNIKNKLNVNRTAEIIILAITEGFA